MKKLRIGFLLITDHADPLRDRTYIENEGRRHPLLLRPLL